MKHPTLDLGSGQDFTVCGIKPRDAWDSLSPSLSPLLLLMCTCSLKINNFKETERDKEGYYIMMKGTTQQEDITITNIYAANMGEPKYIIINRHKGGN